MFANDYTGHYGHNWNIPGTQFGQHNPYSYGWGTMPHNFYGFGQQIPYLHNQNNWSQNTGWIHGQTIPQTYATNPFNMGMHGMGMHGGYQFNHNMNPFTNTYQGQGYTPFYGNINNPFMGCR